MTSRRQNSEIGSPLESSTYVFLLIAVVLIIGLYFIMRFSGAWGETDTYTFVIALREMYTAGELVPPGYAYSNGYGFSALGVFLFNLSSISIASFQLLGAPLLATVLVLSAWLLFREFTGTRLAATLATLILLVQPEFLFPILRGTHEKFTRSLMMLCLYLLLRSLRSRDNISRFTGFVLAFYLSAFSLITFNNLNATSFIIAISISLLVLWVVEHRGFLSNRDEAPIPRLSLIVISLIVISFVITFYAYPPAQHQILLFKSIWDQIAALLLPVEESTAINPYTVVSTGWINLPVYFAVSIANWLLLALSLVIWVRQTYYWITHRRRPTQRELLLWSFYSVFAFLGAVSVVVDVSGALAANLQHRIFASFALFASPLVASQPVSWQSHPGRKTRIAKIGAVLVIGLLACLSILKATNEPLVSNYWVFHSPDESRAVSWSDRFLDGRVLWAGFDERLSTGIGIQTGAAPLHVSLDQYYPNINVADYLISSITHLRSQRIKAPLPIEVDSFVTYDNGEAQIYHRRPRTPYQR